MQPLIHTDLTKKDSETINALRVLLIVLVVFIHMLPSELKTIEWDWNSQCLYDIFTELISHNIGQIAVPGFFILSGYFFFLGVPFNNPIQDWLLPKWKKRIFSLVIPYFAWNLIMIILILVKSIIWSALGESQDDLIMITNSSFYKLFWAEPVNFPLWYLRDLICMCLLAPAFFYLFKYLKWFAFLVILPLSFDWIKVPFPGFSGGSFLFFGLGAYLGISRINIIQICRKIKVPAIISSFFLLIAALLANSTTWHSYVIVLFVPMAFATIVNIIDSSNSSVVHSLSKLSGSVFFIFAAHEIYITGVCNGLSLRLFGGTLRGWTLRYCFEPFMIIFICLVLFQITKKVLPRTLSVLCGSHT